MKFQSVFLKDPCHGPFAVYGHTLAVGSAIEVITNEGEFFVVKPFTGLTQLVPASNVRNALVLPENETVKKGK